MNQSLLILSKDVQQFNSSTRCIKLSTVFLCSVIDSQPHRTTAMDSIKSNQLSNKLDLTSSALLPAALPWGHDPETSKWFLYERSSRLRRDPYQVHSILKLVSNRIQTEYGIEPSSD